MLPNTMAQRLLLAALAALHFGWIETGSAAPVTVTLDGTVGLSELDDYSEEDLVSASFTYDSNSTGEVFTSKTSDLTEVYYAGITASFQNASKTLEVQTSEARVTIRLTVDRNGEPHHSLRLHFPIKDIPTPQSRETTSFIGFVSLTTASPSTLASGKLPDHFQPKDYSYASFLFAWNRFRGDEAPLEYGGQFEQPKPGSLTLELLPHGELYFPTRLGKRYQIQYSDDLKTWASFGQGLDGTGSAHRQGISTKANAMRVFRVREE